MHCLEFGGRGTSRDSRQRFVWFSSSVFQVVPALMQPGCQKHFLVEPGWGAGLSASSLDDT